MCLTINIQLYVFTSDIFLKQGWLEKIKKQLFASLSATLEVFSLVQMLIHPLYKTMYAQKTKSGKSNCKGPLLYTSMGTDS